MKNWLPAEFGSLERAIERTPQRVMLLVELGLNLIAGPPVPHMSDLLSSLVSGSPPWIMKPLMTR